MLITFLIAALASVALASGVPHSAPCDCKAECESLGGWRYCYVDGGASCELAWRSWIHPGEAYVPCPAAEPTNDGNSRPERSLLQFNDDDDEKEKKQNCKGDWSDWGECALQGGKLQKCRTYEIKTPAAGGGKECKNNDGEEECESKGCEVDCEGDWSDWGGCEQKGGKLQKCRTYEIKTPAAGGKECKNNDGEEECESKGCEVDCEGDWSDWGGCEQKGGKLQKCRTYEIKTPAAGGKECKNDDGEEECESKGCEVDCEGDWSDWGGCEQKGGKLQKCRAFKIKTPAAGGKECKNDDGEEECESKGCKDDGKDEEKGGCEGDWSDWGGCEQKQGEWQRCRTYEIAAVDGGMECERNAGEEMCEACLPGPSILPGSGLLADLETATTATPDCVGEFSEPRCVPWKVAGGVASDGSQKLVQVYRVIQEPFEGGKACPFEDGFEKAVGGPFDPKNFCRCNSPTYSNRLSTQSTCDGYWDEGDGFTVTFRATIPESTLKRSISYHIDPKCDQIAGEWVHNRAGMLSMIMSTPGLKSKARDALKRKGAAFRTNGDVKTKILDRATEKYRPTSFPPYNGRPSMGIVRLLGIPWWVTKQCRPAVHTCQGCLTCTYTFGTYSKEKICKEWQGYSCLSKCQCEKYQRP